MRQPTDSQTPPESGKQLPHNLEAEQALLGSLLVSNNMIDSIPDQLGGLHFFEPLHGRVFEEIKQRIHAGRDASPISLKDRFASDEAMRELGGPAYLARLAEAGFSFVHARDYADTVYGLALRRMLIEVAGEIGRTAFDGASEIEPVEQVRFAEEKLHTLGERGKLDEGFQSFVSIAASSVERADKARRQGGAPGLSTGLSDLDAIIGGLKETDLIIIAGRTSMGKSALAVNMAFHIARELMMKAEDDKSGERRGVVAYYSLEMDGMQLVNRVLSAQSRIFTHKIQSGRLSEVEFESFIRTADDLSRLPLYVNDAGLMTIDHLCSSARRLQRQRGLKVIFVDYLQLLESSLWTRRENRVQQVAEVTRRLKALAKDLNVPVIALAQLSRQVETRESRIPQLSDLRESGSIEQDADIVLLLHRQEYYLQREKPNQAESEKFQNWQDKMAAVHNQADIFVAKHRNGRTGEVTAYFDIKFTQFSDLSELGEEGADPQGWEFG